MGIPKTQGLQVAVLSAVQAMVEPRTGERFASLQMLEKVTVEDQNVGVDLVLPSPGYDADDQLAAAVQQAAKSVEGVHHVTVASRVDVLSVGAGPLPTVRNAIAIASGKGGVGKSTVASNLAVSLAAEGARVGLLDCDIYGPSVPMLMGAKTRPVIDENKRIHPTSEHGVTLMSMGFLVSPDDAMVWRGPMLHGALTQFIEEVEWGELDYLLLDLPPGTGDIQITLAQKVPLAGALIVTTPQDVALEDVRRGKAMFDQVKVETLGLVENMSYFLCGNCNLKHEIFASGGGRQAAADLQIPLLGEIPLETVIREGGDRGRPVSVSQPDSASAKVFREIALDVGRRVAVNNQRRRMARELQL